ncbi:hypothetical protein Q4E93_09635 [Flavitalea sp. BT771]|uniref:hypothetical protein n=1 Tax=Flavitalea sp. BT771 TaxID=3063329 RepID=UPI0026E22E58|nr:hypothetical protein [Flavitalea sp. BT771]MDO6430851.1 hypothetical protein [Flavitalea sp. BT771]MDV6219009.1 hypothetical protein [Flavitalea sp. BT771]
MTRHPALSVTAVFVIPVFFASCATVLNGPAQNIRIGTDKNIRRVSMENALFEDSSGRPSEVPGTYLVRRNNKTLVIHIQLDSGEKILRIRPHNSLAYWLNIENYCLGMLVDKDNPKRYAYRCWSYLALKDTAITLRRFAPVPLGTVRFSLSVPLINSFSLISPEGRSSPTGPLGLEAGVDYFYKPDHYISLSAGAASSVFADHLGKGYFTTGHTFFGSIRNNLVIGSFDLGYGLSFSNLFWQKVTRGDTVNLDRSVRSTGIGFSLSAQYRVSKSFRVGILYQPGLYTVSPTPSFNYQHYISAGLAWRWPIKRRI